jgi:hypothetical protein
MVMYGNVLLKLMFGSLFVGPLLLANNVGGVRETISPNGHKWVETPACIAGMTRREHGGGVTLPKKSNVLK